MLHFTGMYGAGFLAMTVAALLLLLTPRRSILTSLAVLVAAIGISFLPSSSGPSFGSPSSVFSVKPITVSGVQLEFPSETEVVDALDKLLARVPESDLFFLSEYTFVNDLIPEPVLDWCRRNHRYLLVGGKDPAPPSNFYDTAFVVGPSGDIVFRQGKSVPIQFMKDGLPAKSQALWDSPWGKIGICICYDLSYTRVTDHLVKLGAQALFVPTMDVVDWGCHEHELQAHVAPVRAAEYGIPVLRVASSGISQFTDRVGTAPSPPRECPVRASKSPPRFSSPLGDHGRSTAGSRPSPPPPPASLFSGSRSPG